MFPEFSWRQYIGSVVQDMYWICKGNNTCRTITIFILCNYANQREDRDIDMAARMGLKKVVSALSKIQDSMRLVRYYKLNQSRHDTCLVKHY